MHRVGLLILCACAASPQRPVALVDPPAAMPSQPQVPPGVAPVTAPVVATLDPAEVKANSHLLLAAHDRADLAALEATTLPTFALYEEARYFDRAHIEKQLLQRIEGKVPERTRTWSDERVLGDATTAIFIGRSAEVWHNVGGQPPFEQDGYNTIVWVRRGEAWRAAFWQWDRAGIDAERQRWNDWLKSGVGFNHKPNQLLVDTVKGKKPGTALDLGSGQGRNAVFLAKERWTTTAVDIADEGLAMTRDAAASFGVKVATVEADHDKWDLGTNKWDLVTMIYTGTSASLVARIKPSLKKGGLFVSEYFHADSDAAKSGAGGWRTGELAAMFKPGFKILRDDVVEDHADWAGQRKMKLVRFVAQKL